MPGPPAPPDRDADPCGRAPAPRVRGGLLASAEGEALVRLRVKAELRKRMRGLRQTTPAEACAARSQRIVQTLLGHAWVSSARGVALFWPIEGRHEVDLRPLDAKLRARGVRVAYPAIADDGEMVFRWVEHPTKMAERGHLFCEPSEQDALVEADGVSHDAIDVVIVPAVAVDPAGHRIGYGAGYYDRALARRADARGTRAIAVAYDFQLISEVPVTDGDVAVDLVVTDARVLLPSARA